MHITTAGRQSLAFRDFDHSAIFSNTRQGNSLLPNNPGLPMTGLSPRILLTDPLLSPTLLNSVDKRRRDMLPSVLERAMHASLEINEGRLLRFALLLENDIVKSGPTARFASPMPLDSRHLHSLGIALDPRKNCLVVDACNSSTSCLEIIGIAPRPVPELRLTTVNQITIVVEAENPGVISLEIGKLKAVYNRGNIHHINTSSIEQLQIQSSLPSRALSPTHLGPYLHLGIGEVVPLDAMQWKNHQGELAESVNSYSPRLFAGFIEAIARKIRNNGHGGGFILLPNLDCYAGLFEGGRWFKEPDKRVTHWLSRALSLQGLLSLGLRGKRITSDLDAHWQENIQQWARDIVHPSFRDALINLDLTSEECARLTEADGATVLTHDFEILAFGASIVAAMQELPREWIEHLGTYGNRHRSMARAVAAVNGSLGIVVSQDGGVTIFSNDNTHGKRLLKLTM